MSHSGEASSRLPGDALGVVLASMSDCDDGVRLAALRALVQMPLDQRAWRDVSVVVFNELRDPSDGGASGPERRAAFSVAGGVPTRRVRQRLRELSNMGSPEDRASALEALVAARDEAAIDQLVRDFEGDDLRVRIRAARRLAAVGLPSDRIGELSDDDDKDLSFWLGLAEARSGDVARLQHVLDRLDDGEFLSSVEVELPGLWEQQLSPLVPLTTPLTEFLASRPPRRPAGAPWDDPYAAVSEIVGALLELDRLAHRPRLDHGVNPAPEPVMRGHRTAADEVAASIIGEDRIEPRWEMLDALAPSEGLDAGALISSLFGRTVDQLSGRPGGAWMTAGNAIVIAAGRWGQFVPDLPRLFDTYRRTHDLRVEYYADEYAPLRWQIAWVVSRATVPAILAETALRLASEDTLDRIAALQVLEDAMKYRSSDYGPVFGGGGPPLDTGAQPGLLIDDIEADHGAAVGGGAPPPPQIDDGGDGAEKVHPGRPDDTDAPAAYVEAQESRERFAPDPTPEEPAGSLDDKRIAAWIKGHEREPRSLVRDVEHRLLMRVGSPVAGSLLDGPESLVPARDMPPEGLATRWTVSSRDADLRSDHENEITVQETRLDGVTWFVARFSLTIPRRGDSDTVALMVVPRSAVRARLEVTIDALGARYRDLTIDLPVSDDRSPVPDLAAPIVDEDIVTAASSLGVRPRAAWLTSPVELTVRVTGDRAAQLNGTVRVGMGLRDVEDFVRWDVGPADVAGLIKNVRGSAERFRARREAYLNAIDPQDLARRLAAFSPSRDWSQAPDLSDRAHEYDWIAARDGDELRELAYDAHELFCRFFPEKPGEPLRQWLETSRPGDRFDVHWTSNAPHVVPHVPWGLMYVLDPAETIDPMGFLGLRLRLSYRAYRTNAPDSSALGNPSHSYRANLLYWGGQDGDVAATESEWQRKSWQTIAKQVFVPDQAGPDAKQALLAVLKHPDSRPLSVLYLFCRCDVGDGQQIVLRFGSTNDVADVLRRFDMPTAQLDDRPLVFANACTTAASDPYYSNELERGFLDRGARGFIGTETKVPIVLASRMAAVFFHLLGRRYDNAPMAAGEALAQARLFLWQHYRNVGGLFYAYINKYDLYLVDEAEVQSLRV